MLWRKFQEIHMRKWHVLYTRVPEETDQNWGSPLRGRQNGPPHVPDWGWVYDPCWKAGGRAFVSLFAVEEMKSRRRVSYWLLDVTTKTH